MLKCGNTLSATIHFVPFRSSPCLNGTVLFSYSVDSEASSPWERAGERPLLILFYKVHTTLDELAEGLTFEHAVTQEGKVDELVQHLVVLGEV